MNPTLEVQGHPGIFALGDVIDWNEQKQAAKGGAHGAVVAKNVLAVLEGKPASALYKGSYEMIVVTYGRVSRLFESLIVK